MNALTAIGNVARWGVRKLLRLYYPRIEVEGRENVPASGPVLFVANHPNSLLDPVLIGHTVQRPVHFFAKAPIFDVPVLGDLMRALGMVPAYRGQDDKAAVRRNLETLEIGARQLLKGEAVGIFPEGKSHDREGVEQVRTGAARIAWAAVQGGAALTVVPLGLNYERKERFRSSVWVRIGEPLEARSIFHAAEGEERRAMRRLTEEIDARLKRLVVHLAEERWQPFLPELEVLLPAEGSEANDSIAALRQRKRLADAVNHFLALERPRAEAMAAAIERQRAELSRVGLTLGSPVLRRGAGRLAWELLKETLRLLLGLLPALAGVFHHLVPFALTRAIVPLVKNPGRTTVAQARLLLGLPIYGLWYAAIWWLLATRTQVWIACLWTALMPLAGIAALHYFWRARTAGRAWWHELKLLARPKEMRRLRFAQAELQRQLRRLREEYRVRKEAC